MNSSSERSNGIPTITVEQEASSEGALSKPVKTRKRGFSLRTQLFSKNVAQSAENYLTTPEIELKQVDNSYLADELDVFRHDDSSTNQASLYGSSASLNQSVIDLNDEPQYKYNYTQRTTSKYHFIKATFNALMGISNAPESRGGRRLPITVNLKRSDEPSITNKKGEVLLLDNRTNQPYVNNVITSSKYTLLSFLPRQLIAQFSKLANCYFMTVAILQLIPSWSTTGTSTTIIPLSIFISISILREGWDDLRRHKLDKVENNKPGTVLKMGNSHYSSHYVYSKSTTSFSRLRSSTQSFDTDDLDSQDENMIFDENSFANEQLLSKEGISTIRTRWKDIKVGDIVKIDCDEWVPADVVLLTSTNDMGETLVETMALDGETNLKSKLPNQELHKLANSIEGLRKLKANIHCEDPNSDLYNFEGSLDIEDPTSHETRKFALGPDNIIYRGSIIRNTDSCLGVVVFSGEETKIRMNSIKNPRIKAPKLQKSINYIVAFMVFVVASLAMFSFMAERMFYKRYRDKNWYIRGEDAGIAPTIMSFIIMYNTLIPLSLYVTMEIIKAIQMVLLQWDIDMYHPQSNTPAEARTATILEELGQVSYIFSDKTGTLTDNVMIFRKFSVCGTAWIHDMDQSDEKASDTSQIPLTEDSLDGATNVGRGITRSGPAPLAGRSSMSSVNPSLVTAQTAKMQNLNFKPSIKSSAELIRYLQTNPNTIYAKRVTFFLLSIALCHSCFPKRTKTDSVPEMDTMEGFEEEIESINYQASSPDELALVQAACEMGFILFEKRQKTITLKLYPRGFNEEPEFEDYEILDVVEFSSNRKRMSVILRLPDSKIVLFCKGADNVIMERLRNSQVAHSKQQEFSRNVANRKRYEAELILQRRSMDSVRSREGRSSTSSVPRPSLSLSRSSMEGVSPVRANQASRTIDSVFSEDSERHELEEIKTKARRSLQLKQTEKYNLREEISYIPSDRLVVNDEYVLEKTIEHVEDFSTEGLRTLLYSYRYLSEDVYSEWSQKYGKAKTSLTNRAELVEKIGCQLEENLELLGATAIEDKLQKGVPATIEKLRRAGIKLWMLTGDKRETAINIGYSCRLIKDYSKVIVLSSDEGTERLSSIMTAAELEIEEGNVAHCVVVIDGGTLSDIEMDNTLMTVFISLCMKSDTVICCRASPSQKAKMVTSVRNLNKSKVTLAIGDGANDIAMIQSADVGVGITGKEGLQAARTSDYSIAQFRYLLKLLLVHGRYNYIRTSKFVLCTFYKELLFYLTQLLYQRYTLFTGTSLYESWSLSMFNTLFTSLPVLCIGMFDKDLRPSTLIAVPELYARGRNCESFNFKLFLFWSLLAASQSTTLCFCLWNVYGFPATLDNTTYPLGVVMFTVLIVIINAKCNIIEMHSITKLSLISFCVSVFGWLLWCMLLVGLYKRKDSTIYYVSHGLFEHFGKDITFWASILVLIVVGLSIDMLFHLVKVSLWPTDTDAFQVLEKNNRLRKQMELNAFDVLAQSWTWMHESQLVEQDIENYSSMKKGLYQFRSFLKKGSIHPSKQTRKRKQTLVNPTELPAGSPASVKIASFDLSDQEMLPSGKIIRHRGDDHTFTRIFKKQEETRDIESILDERMRHLEDMEK
ncbi:hypothetical protein KL905_001358 [Ogataea polymorpha]|nr:hypothetical protein KL937_002749 [Ogataea polymorpha]KAG7896951.1 hypothetical protein KL908_000353 [Ogataea polymorpha]KAG7903244.1 hypothetical protein KL935_000776 [Ogataea polymorpha]KAG7912150.1 hypothetical protein KL906_000354 [Ogataea polymorpha]KAG7913278.1 hypothetical protein KL907_000223 [Ogataea polymorpha]